MIYFARHNIHEYDNLVVDCLNKVSDEWANSIVSIRSSSEDYLIKLWDENYNELSAESIKNIASTLRFYQEHQPNKDNTIEIFLEKVKKSKFGQEEKDDKLKFLFLSSKSLSE